MEWFKEGALPKGAIMSNLGGNCPVQGEGVWHGREIYFRARGDAWSLVVEKGKEPGACARKAFGSMGNAGWVDRELAAEMIRAHLWVWDAQERRLEWDEGSGGSALHALIALDPEALSLALAKGALVNEPPCPGHPTLLCLALMLSDESGAEKNRDDLRIDMLSCWDPSMLRRTRCVELLLQAGADPSVLAPGWIVPPAQWAVCLPAGQRTLFADMLSGESSQHVGVQEQEQERCRLNPIWALAEAGADLGAHAAQSTPLVRAIDASSMVLAEEIAKILGGDAMRQVAEKWMGLLQIDVSMASIRDERSDKTSDKFSGLAFERLLSAFGSGEWPVQWLYEAGDELQVSSEVVSELKARLIAHFESEELVKVTGVPQKSVAVSRL